MRGSHGACPYVKDAAMVSFSHEIQILALSPIFPSIDLIANHPAAW
jgi:hypothetical protein